MVRARVVQAAGAASRGEPCGRGPVGHAHRQQPAGGLAEPHPAVAGLRVGVEVGQGHGREPDLGGVGGPRGRADLPLAGLAGGDDGAVADLDEGPELVGQPDPPGGQQRRQVVELVGRRVVVLGGADVESEPLATLDAVQGDPGDGGDGGLDAHGSDRCYRLARPVPSIQRSRCSRSSRTPWGPSTTRSAASSSSRRGLLGADRDPQAAAGLGGDGEAGQVAEVVAGHDQAAGAGLGGHPADGVALVAADLGAQLPHHPPGHHLQAVGGRDPLGGLADRAGPAGRVGDPAGVDGDRVALVLQVGAALQHRRVGGQVLAGGRDRRPGRLQAPVHLDPALDDLLQPVHAQVADPGGGGVAGQVGRRPAGDEGGGGVAVGQRPEQLDDPGQRPGRRRVLDDRGDGAVEVQADGHLGGPPGQPGGQGGHRPGAGHGRPRAAAGRRGGRLVPVASLALVSRTARAGSRPALASTNAATSSGHG